MGGSSAETMVRFLFLAVCLATFLSASANENAFREDPEMILAEVGSSMGSGSDSSTGDDSGSSSTSMGDDSGSSSTSMGDDSGSSSTPTDSDSGSGSSSTMSTGSGSSDVCEDTAQSDGTEWYDADGEYYDCEWYASYESYCDWYGDDYASEMDGLTASQACCTCGGGSTAGVVLLEAKAKAKGPIMAKPSQGESMLVDVDAVVPEYDEVVLAEVGTSGSGSGMSMDSGSGSGMTIGSGSGSGMSIVDDSGSGMSIVDDSGSGMTEGDDTGSGTTTDEESLAHQHMIKMRINKLHRMHRKLGNAKQMIMKKTRKMQMYKMRVVNKMKSASGSY